MCDCLGSASSALSLPNSRLPIPSSSSSSKVKSLFTNPNPNPNLFFFAPIPTAKSPPCSILATPVQQLPSRHHSYPRLTKNGAHFLEFHANNNPDSNSSTPDFDSTSCSKGHSNLDDDDDDLDLLLTIEEPRPDPNDGPLSVDSKLNNPPNEKSQQHNTILRRAKQLMSRSNFIAKQVITIHSALCLGFISQLWVDVHSWSVLVVEIRPNLLSGESERFLLEDVVQVGDVVLIENDSAIGNDLKLVGLETLVGYNVVTPGRRNIGKVRGYTFDMNSGAVESLELDSFGISIIPSSLVNTYALFVEDVLAIVSDTIVVHESAASRLQRLTKGFLGAQNVLKSMDHLDEYADVERESVQFNHKSRRSSFANQKVRPKKGDASKDWELPMDYL